MEAGQHNDNDTAVVVSGGIRIARGGWCGGRLIFACFFFKTFFELRKLFLLSWSREIHSNGVVYLHPRFTPAFGITHIRGAFFGFKAKVRLQAPSPGVIHAYADDLTIQAVP